MATQTVRNGQAIRLNVLPGQSVAVVAVSGTYNASIVQGAGIGAIATAATGATYGPYANGIVILLTASAASEIDFAIAVTPVIVSDTLAKFNAAGTALVDPVSGRSLAVRKSYAESFTRDVTVGVDYPTLMDAIKDLSGLSSVYKIYLPDGILSESLVDFNYYDTSNIALEGLTSIPLTINSVQSVTQVSGYAHDVVLNMDTVVGLVANEDYIVIRSLTDGLNPEQLYGVSLITAIDTVNTRITLRINLNTAQKPSGLVTGGAFVNKTRISSQIATGGLFYIRNITFVNAPAFTLQEGGKLGFGGACSGMAFFNTGLIFNIGSTVNFDNPTFGGRTVASTYAIAYYSVRGHADGCVFGNSNGLQTGLFLYSGISLSVWSTTAVNCTIGIDATDLSIIAATTSIFVDCATGIKATLAAQVTAEGSTYTRCTTNTVPPLDVTAVDGSLVTTAASVAGLHLSKDPTQTNVTASRALNTTYTNTSSKSIQIVATVRFVITLAAGSATVQGKSDAATPPVTIASGLVGIQAGLLNEDNTHQINFIVAAGKKYRVDSAVSNGTATLGSWFETAF